MCIITMKAMTQAQRGQKVLWQKGVESEIVSLDGALTKNGCSYGLSVLSADCKRAENILNEYHVGYGRVIGGYI